MNSIIFVGKAKGFLPLEWSPVEKALAENFLRLKINSAA